MLISKLMERGHEVSGIKRELLYGPANLLASEIRNADIVLHLAGAPIFQRWTKKNKKLIYESRIVTTKNLVEAINLLSKKDRPKKYVSSSAIGIYKSDFEHDEDSMNFDNGFIGNVVKDWENASKNLPKDVQKNILRIGLIIGKNAKTIKYLWLPVKLGLGATVGHGKQPFPFVHEKDVIKAFLWIIEENQKQGIFNIVAPENISNKEFTQAFANALKRPMFLMIPKLIFKLLFGEASVLLTQSAQVIPKNLLENKFEFTFPTINAAMKEIF